MGKNNSKSVVCYKVSKNQTIAHLKKVCAPPKVERKKDETPVPTKNIRKVCQELLVLGKVIDDLIASIKSRLVSIREERNGGQETLS